MIFDLVTVASFSVAVPMATGLFLYRKLPGATHYLIGLLIAWFVAEVCAYTLRLYAISNWNVYVLLSFAEIITVTMFYKSIYTNKAAGAVASWVGCCGIGVVIMEYALTGKPSNTLTILFESTFFTALSLYLFYEVIILDAGVRFMEVNSCILVLFVGSAIYFASWQFLTYDKHMFMLFGNAHAYLLLICYSLLTVALWRLRV